jgi:hypothetical protein
MNQWLRVNSTSSEDRGMSFARGLVMVGRGIRLSEAVWQILKTKGYYKLSISPRTVGRIQTQLSAVGI